MQRSPLQIKEMLLEAVDKDMRVLDTDRVSEIVNLLQSYPITVEQLEVTRLGLLVNNIRRQATSQELALQCRHLILQWRKIGEDNSNGRSPALAHHQSAAVRGHSTPAVVTHRLVDKSHVENRKKRKHDGEIYSVAKQHKSNGLSISPSGSVSSLSPWSRGASPLIARSSPSLVRLPAPFSNLSAVNIRDEAAVSPMCSKLKSKNPVSPSVSSPSPKFVPKNTLRQDLPSDVLNSKHNSAQGHSKEGSMAVNIVSNLKHPLNNCSSQTASNGTNDDINLNECNEDILKTSHLLVSNPSSVLWPLVDQSEPSYHFKQPGPLSSDQVDRIHSDRWEHVNGSYNSSNQWCEWFNCKSTTSCGEDMLDIMPYVFFD